MNRLETYAAAQGKRVTASVSLMSKLDEYKAMAEEFAKKNGFTLDQIKTGSDAWTVAHRSGIAADAYRVSRDVTDAHIKTVLSKIMPNAVFKDKYRH